MNMKRPRFGHFCGGGAANRYEREGIDTPPDAKPRQNVHMPMRMGKLPCFLRAVACLAIVQSVSAEPLKVHTPKNSSHTTHRHTTSSGKGESILSTTGSANEVSSKPNKEFSKKLAGASTEGGSVSEFAAKPSKDHSKKVAGSGAEGEKATELTDAGTKSRTKRAAPVAIVDSSPSSPSVPSSPEGSTPEGSSSPMMGVGALAVLLLLMWYGKRCAAAGEASQLSAQDLAFLVSALVLNTLTAPMVKLTQNAAGGYDFNQSCVYFFAEVFKLTVAGGWCAFYLLRGDETYRPTSVERDEVLQYAVPGFVFFMQNNLSFIALQHMSSAAFQLLLNLRIIAVAVLSVLVLGKQLNKLEWTAVTLLMIGAMQYQLSSCSAGSMKVSTAGVSVMMIIIACAAGGNIYTQKVMQKKMSQPLMLQNSVLYAWGVLFNGLNWLQTLIGGKPAFGSLGFWPCASMVFYAVYGLSISVIIKQFGSVTRTFVNTAAICCTALLDFVVLGEKVSVLEGTTFAIILIAIYIYSIPAPELAKLQAAAAKPTP